MRWSVYGWLVASCVVHRGGADAGSIAMRVKGLSYRKRQRSTNARVGKEQKNGKGEEKRQPIRLRLVVVRQLKMSVNMPFAGHRSKL